MYQMSLRTRIHLLVTVLTILFLIVGLMFIIHGARQAIEAEVRSAKDLTAALLESAVGGLDDRSDSVLLKQRLLERMEETGPYRHVRIAIRREGEAPITQQADTRAPDAPAWFTRLVAPDNAVVQREIPLAPGQTAWLEVHAEPADEITETWVGSRNLLLLLIGFAVVASGSFHWAARRFLRPVGDILNGLDRLERGKYNSRLPAFSTSELSDISSHFNRLAEALERTRERNRQLTRQILDVQETERRQIARELHDELGQHLSSVKADATFVSKRVSGHDPSVISAAQAMLRSAEHMHALTRDLVHRLHPAVLDELGLAAALRELVGEWRSRNEAIHCRYDAKLHSAGLDTTLAMHLYRIVQECLTNITRHSRATEVTVTLNEVDQTIRLSITDNGVGFDAANGGVGFGLLGMQERVAALGGRFRVQSSPAGGTAIHVILPFHGPLKACPATPPHQAPHPESRDAGAGLMPASS